MEDFAYKLKQFGQYLIDNSEILSDQFEKTERFEKTPSVPNFIGKAYMKFVLKNESLSKKVNLKEFKEIVKNVIKEEMIKENEDVKKMKVINTLTDFAGDKKNATKMVNVDYKNIYDEHKEKDANIIARKIQAQVNKDKSELKTKGGK